MLQMRDDQVTIAWTFDFGVAWQCASAESAVIGPGIWH